MISEFSQKTKESIKYYVYILIDPRYNQIFYIGKGKDNRCFSHIDEAINNTDNISEKCDHIREILNNSKNVIIKILRHNLTEDEALLVESACIDLLGDQTTNIVSGHHSRESGLMSIEEIEMTYNAQVLNESDITDPIIFINLNNAYESSKGDPDQLYEATRKAWKVDINKASKVKYAIATYKGISRAVYLIHNWYPSSEAGRHEFNGELASQEIQEKYNGKSLVNFLKVGAQNPIKYYFMEKS